MCILLIFANIPEVPYQWNGPLNINVYNKRIYEYIGVQDGNEGGHICFGLEVCRHTVNWRDYNRENSVLRVIWMAYNLLAQLSWAKGANAYKVTLWEVLLILPLKDTGSSGKRIWWIVNTYLRYHSSTVNILQSVLNMAGDWTKSSITLETLFSVIIFYFN